MADNNNENNNNSENNNNENNNNNNENNNAVVVAEEASAIVPVAAVEEPKPCNIEKEIAVDVVAAETGDAPAMKCINPFLELSNLEKLLKTITMIFSIPVLGFIVWLFYVRASDCEGILKLPSFQLGVGFGLIFLFVISNCVVYYSDRCPVLGLLIVMVPLLLVFVIGLALVGAYKMESRSVAASPKWLRLKVFNDAHWADIKSCIYDTGACDDLVSRTLMLKAYDFGLKKFSPIEAGCCTPATICQMDYVNATFWTRKEGGAAQSSPYDSDCDLWDNDRGNLCYNCVSCKTGFLKTLQAKWLKLGVFLIVISLMLFLAHLTLFLISVFQQFRV